MNECYNYFVKMRSVIILIYHLENDKSTDKPVCVKNMIKNVIKEKDGKRSHDLRSTLTIIIVGKKGKETQPWIAQN